MANEFEHVRVVVKCRPLSKGEPEAGNEDIVDVDASKCVVQVRNPSSSDNLSKTFAFEAVYDCTSRQRDLFDGTVKSLIQSVLNGFNATIFTYGQTGAGKTYTMQGLKDEPEELGIIQHSFQEIFKHIATSDNQYLVRGSYLDIYQENIRDLLAEDHYQRLRLRESPDIGFYVEGLSAVLVKDAKELEEIMHLGNCNRAVRITNMGEISSRSSAIFTLTVQGRDMTSAGTNKESIQVGKLMFADLAGNERHVNQTGETTKVVNVLSALGYVIHALTDPKTSHVPYRDSQLTRLLRDSLGGNAKTVMIANVDPASHNYEQTLLTLRYANRVKEIKNIPRINEVCNDVVLLQQFQEDISRLKRHVDERSTLVQEIIGMCAVEEYQASEKDKVNERKRRSKDEAGTTQITAKMSLGETNASKDYIVCSESDSLLDQ